MARANASSLTPEAKFWHWFSTHQALYHEGVDDPQRRDDLFEALTHRLQQVCPELTFEFSSLRPTGIREFAISPDGIRAYFPAAERLAQAAPDLPGWQIYAFRQRVDGEGLRIQFGDTSVSYNDIFFRYADEEDGIGVELYIRGYTPDNGPMQHAVFILLDTLLGEYDTAMRISWIDWYPLDETEQDHLAPFLHLRALIDARK
ncbi:hypothetical protein SAMN05421823_1236 [Catalinimonas alkaloidigena]|uniref:DUF695 domain-containing protein n=1 Tax=Catalinimonas alkaloidigena TaxID=1075417 RepID=A0A1G9VQU1_9BACT|nr:hypothetical protein [Catalinimonas alkaloidigena]SDM74548.1 hypothetical protein SAMN05421823_1236 [Catalinimonas alkaloidigena]